MRGGRCMFKIQEFAELCCCTTQTLRYYDRVHLFKPYYIENVTGYRYYQENQIYEYYKIKQLQNAGFSIKEIKQLKGKMMILC